MTTESSDNDIIQHKTYTGGHQKLFLILRNYAVENGEPQRRSGRQEFLENLVNRYI